MNRIGTARLLAYSAPAVPISMLTMPLIMFVPTFYAQELGLGLASVGLVFFLARAWDGIIDPVAGYLSDKTQSRWGRRKPWVLASTPFLMVLTVLLCQPPEHVSGTYLFVVIMLFYVAWAALQIPYQSWGADLSDDYLERNRIVGYREGALMAGVLVATGLPILILPEQDPSLLEILRVFTWSVLVILPVTVLIALRGCGPGPAPRQDVPPLRDALSSVARNRHFLRLLAGLFALWLGLHIYNACIIMVLDFIAKLPSSAFLEFVLAQFVVGVAFTPFIVKLANRFGKHRVLACSAIGVGALLPLYFVIPPDAYWVVFGLFLLKGLVISPIWVLPTSIVADAVDVGMLEGGGDQAGTYMALYNLINKLALALSVGIALPLLGLLGFDPAGENGPSAIVDLGLVGLVLPGLVWLGAIAALWNYPVTREFHADVRRQLAAGSSATE
jgi:GPH family glycoside/pentoside/hexuronide:cation symporter